MSRDILTSLIDRDETQPRQHFEPAALAELAQSIAENGLAVPILVRPVGERFMIVHGERRYRAVCSLGWASIPADVRDIAPDAAQWLALVENIQRSDLSPTEEARAYQARLAGGMTQEALGQKIGKSQSYIAQKLRLLSLPDPLLVLLDRKAISEGHARQILRLKAMYYDMTETYTGNTLDAERFRPVLVDAKTAEPSLLAQLYHQMRIEDYPIAWMVPQDEQQILLMRDTFLAFLDYAARHNNTIPLWTRAAFWWAALSAYTKIGVATLGKAIDQWYDRMLSCVGWSIIRPEMPPIVDRNNQTAAETVQQILYWGIRSDLGHGGISPHLGNLPRELTLNALGYMGQHEGATALPSILQPGGSEETQAQYESALEKIPQE